MTTGWGLRKTIPAVVLPEGYCGKILLAAVTIGPERLVILRSGDLWHREILKNTEAEIGRLGLAEARVDELGGAHLRFEADGSILLWGGSEDFGACDLDYAASLIREIWPDRRIHVSPGPLPARPVF